MSGEAGGWMWILIDVARSCCSALRFFTAFRLAETPEP